MDDTIIVVDDDKSSAYTTLGASFVQAGVGASKQSKLKSNPFFSENILRSLSSSPPDAVQNSSDESLNGKALQSEDGMKQICVICGSVANGYHFGALSCAACNAFFRRSVAEARKYFCRKSGLCMVDQAARCFCRACRLKKCLESGMDPNAVQPHRDMIGRKRKSSRDEQRNDSENSSFSLEGSSTPGEKFDEKGKMAKVDLRDLLEQDGKGNFLKSNVVTPMEVSMPCKTSTTSSILTTCASAVSKTPKLDKSGTTQLLTSTDVIAEQLIAFSRAPLVATSLCFPSMQSLCEPENLQAARNQITVPHVVSSMKFSESMPCVNAAEKFEPSLLVSQISQFVEKAKLDSVGQHLRVPSCNGFEQSTATSIMHARSVGNLISDPSSSSANWGCKAESSTPNWNGTNTATKTIPNTVVPAPAAIEYDVRTNVIEVLLDAYRKLRERRRLVFCPNTLRDLLSGTEAPLKCITIGDNMKGDKRRLETGLLVEFFNNIHPFSKLQLEDRMQLFKNAYLTFTLAERHYITMRGGGLQTNRLIQADNSYIDLTSVENVNAEGKSEKLALETSEKMADEDTIDKVTVRRLLLPHLRESVKDISGPMYHCGMTDVEFVGLSVIILLDHTASNISDASRRLVKEARDRMYKDWFAYYEAHGVLDGAEKVGNASLLLPAIYVTCKKHRENYHLVRFFNFFNMPVLIEELMK